MTTENFKNIKELGIFIFLGLFIVYCCIFLCIAFLFFQSGFKSPLSYWIFFGPLFSLQYVGFFISMYLKSGKELTDESDKTEIRERSISLKAGVAGLLIWLIVLIVLERIQVDINSYLSLFCGFTLIFGIFWLLKMADKRSKKI